MLVNTRILHAPLTGVQRYLNEVLNAWPAPLPQTIAPPVHAFRGLRAHAWEQTVLPLRVRGQLLWSPVHSGPVGYRNQVVTVHDVVPLDHPEWLNPSFARWYRWMLPRLLRKAQHVIAISEFTQRRIVATTGVPESKISVIANGVGCSFRPEAALEQNALRRALRIPDAPYVLSVGSLEPRKNLTHVLQAWQRALPQMPKDWHLLIVGAAGDPRVFSDSSPGEWPDRVLHLNRVDDEFMPSLYAAAECVVYLSLYEGFGLPPLEAMACGTPVIVSDIEVMHEVVGEHGLKASPLDIDAVADRLRQIANDAGFRQHLAQLAIERSSRFSWQKTAAQIHALLRRFE